ncbi:MAG: hypothetical protein QM722_19615 [Piscinibacter sp.]
MSALASLAAALAALEPALEGLRGDAATMERARRAAAHLNTEAARIVALLAASPVSGPWHGQERRGPNRATNIARLPERADAAQDNRPARAHDWEPF